MTEPPFGMYPSGQQMVEASWPVAISPVWHAVQSGSEQEMRTALAGGADVNVRSGDGSTPLMQASKPEQVRLLLEYRADVNATEREGKTALMMPRGATVVRMLLDHGAQVRVLDQDGNTPLHYSWDAETVKLLLARGASLHARNRYGVTPLMSAVTRGIEPVVRSLADSGAKINDEDDKHVSVLMQAMTAHAGSNSLAWVASGSLIRFLVERGADVNKRSGLKPAETPLMVAVDRGNPETVRLLLERGAQVNLFDGYGRTALIRASKRGYPELVQMLVDHGAAIRWRDEDGKSALDYVRDHRSRVHRQCEAILIKAGAKP